MSIELKQVAQDAAEAIDWLLKNIRLDAPQLSGKAMGNAEKCANALRIALSQQPDNTSCKSVQKRLAAQQPATAIACGIPGMVKTTCPYCEQGFAFEHEQSATGEPVKATPYNPTEEMRWAMKRIDPALSSEQCRALWAAAWSVAPSTHPAPSAPKDHQIAAMVNKVRDIARMFHDHQSLRERIAIELVPALKASQEVKSNAERGRFLVGWLKRFGLLQAEFGQIGAGEKPENWWLLHAPWGIDKTRPFFGHGKTPEQAIDAAIDAAKAQKGQG